MKPGQKEWSKYSSFEEWKNNNPDGYYSARKLCIINDMCKHFGWDMKVKPNGYWTLDRCREIAKNYKSRKEWAHSKEKGAGSSYVAARKNGWLDECCKHMIPTRKPMGFWKIKENCRVESLKYGSKIEWLNTPGAKGGYDSAYHNGWLDEFFPESIHKSSNRL